MKALLPAWLVALCALALPAVAQPTLHEYYAQRPQFRARDLDPLQLLELLMSEYRYCRSNVRGFDTRAQEGFQRITQHPSFDALTNHRSRPQWSRWGSDMAHAHLQSLIENGTPLDYPQRLGRAIDVFCNDALRALGTVALP